MSNQEGSYTHSGSDPHGAPVAVYARARDPPQTPRYSQRPHLPSECSWLIPNIAQSPGLFIASGFRGIGLPDCIRDAQIVAAEAIAYLRDRD